MYNLYKLLRVNLYNNHAPQFYKCKNGKGLDSFLEKSQYERNAKKKGVFYSKNFSYEMGLSKLTDLDFQGTYLK